MRETFKLIYRSGMTLVTIGLVISAVAAFWNHTPVNQLGLVGGILAFLALMAGLSISKLDDQDRQAETYAEIGREFRAKMPFTMKFGEGGKIDWNLKDGAFNVQYTTPEVHRVDAAGMEDAKRMAAEGVPIDHICRAIDPEHDRHDPAHQEAFRKIVRAMIEQG